MAQNNIFVENPRIDLSLFLLETVQKLKFKKARKTNSLSPMIFESVDIHPITDVLLSKNFGFLIKWKWSSEKKNPSSSSFWDCGAYT